MRNFISVFCALLMIGIFVTGCGSSSDSDSNSKGQVKVRLSLNWFPDAQHGGFYAAQVHGFFEDEGLDVEIVPGGPGVPVIEKVALQRSEFGVANADQLVLMRSQDAEVVALMAPLQVSPRCIMVHAESNISNFDELQDVTLALGPGRPFAEYLKKKHGLEGVRVVNYSGTVTRFLADKSYAQQGYSISEPFLAQREGADPVCLMLAEIGYSPYTSCLFTSDRYEESNPEVVQKMVNACRRGWQKYLEDPDETNRLIHENNPEMDVESLEFASRELRRLALPDGVDADKVGMMSDKRWRQLAEQLAEIDFVEANFSADQVYRTKYILNAIKSSTSDQEVAGD